MHEGKLESEETFFEVDLLREVISDDFEEATNLRRVEDNVE